MCVPSIIKSKVQNKDNGTLHIHYDVCTHFLLMRKGIKQHDVGVSTTHSTWTP